MRILVEPGIIIDKPLEWEEGLIPDVLVGIVIQLWLKGVVSFLNSVDADKSRILNNTASTELNLTQGLFLLISTW